MDLYSDHEYQTLLEALEREMDKEYKSEMDREYKSDRSHQTYDEHLDRMLEAIEVDLALKEMPSMRPFWCPICASTLYLSEDELSEHAMKHLQREIKSYRRRRRKDKRR